MHSKCIDGTEEPLNSLGAGRFDSIFKKCDLHAIIQNNCLGTRCEFALRRMPQILTNQWIDIGSVNGLLPGGTKPLTEPMLSKVHDAIWRHNKKKLISWCYRMGYSTCGDVYGNGRDLFISSSICIAAPLVTWYNTATLTHWGRETHICVTTLGHHWFR